jgi:hypothetical protein
MQFAPSRVAAGVDSAASTIAGRWRYSSPYTKPSAQARFARKTVHTAVGESGALDSQKAICRQPCQQRKDSIAWIIRHTTSRAIINSGESPVGTLGVCPSRAVPAAVAVCANQIEFQYEASKGKLTVAASIERVENALHLVQIPDEVLEDV